MVAATPSGITLAPEGGAHQSIATPLIGIAQDGLASFEPAFVDIAIVGAADKLVARLPDGKGALEGVSGRANAQSADQPQLALRFRTRDRLHLRAARSDEQLARLNREVRPTRIGSRIESRVSSTSASRAVYDLTEPTTHHFVANGIVVHNCSEYMFLDDTACNLASLNLMKFYEPNVAAFDVDCLSAMRRGCGR